MKRSLRLYLSILLCFAITCMAATMSSAQDKTITIKVASWFPVDGILDNTFRDWGKDLERRAAGKVKVTYYAGGTLVPAPQTYDAVVKGITDVGNHVLGYSMGRFPFSQILDAPIGWPPHGPEATIIDNEFYKKFNQKEFDDVKVLFLHGQPGGFVHTRSKPVTKLEDLKGLRMRSYGSIAKFVGLLGAVPVAMPMTDVYDALAKGLLDGVMSNYQSLEEFRTGEYIKYTTENLHTAYGATFIVAMNKKKFASLPPDVQTIVNKMSEEYIEKWGKAWKESELSGKDWLMKRGVRFITLSKEEEDRWYEKGSKPIVDEYIKEMKAKGLPGDEAAKFLLDSLKRYRK